MFADVQDVTRYIESNGIKLIDLKFIDLPGRWHHITIPVSDSCNAIFDEGIPFDSSSIQGFRGVESGDLSLIPDISTGFNEPFSEIATLSFICNICEADTKEGIPDDPRSIALRADRLLKEKFGADSLWLPELEFYLFDSAEYSTNRNSAYFEFISKENDPTYDGFTNKINGAYHALPPHDTANHLRDQMVELIEDVGVKVRYHHHEGGAFGQQEIEIVPTNLVHAADAVMLMKYIVRMVAYQNNQVATFMPKPLYNEAGTGMHFHQFMVKDGKSLFWDEKGKYTHLSKMALSSIAGILDHAPSIVGITNPSTNSYKRLVEGFEAPTKGFYGLANRCAAIRIPKYDDCPELKRFEFRPPDPTCNPYLAISAQLMAALDGIDRDLNPDEMGFGPFDDDVFAWSKEKQDNIKSLPTDLGCALKALSEDHDYLLKDGVFCKEIIGRHIAHAQKIAEDIKQYPTAREIEMYFDL